MCGRYVFMTDEDNREMNKIMEEISKKYMENTKSGEIFPTDRVPVLVQGADRLTPEMISWGFPNFKNKGVIINARAETAQEKPMFRESLMTRRCVVPSTGFFEWKHDASKQKYLFRLPQETMLYMAGFYNEFQGEKKFVILTAQANASMTEVHDRMPVVLPREQLRTWVYDTGGDMEILQTPPPMLEKIYA